ncbi:hypothetical protein ABT369_23830 [Dactylosporangium sp. NPDC000244]|uniref:hypothetical protein n=1 Tax=Dactylosporangium sp. NPDC000244 TaxID=3154365 RepID=UPI003332951F
MNVSWDVRATDLPLPGRSIVNGRPGAAAATVDAGAPWRRRAVPLPLTAEQAAHFRRYEQARHWGFPVAAAAALALANLFFLPGLGLGVLPVVLFTAPVVLFAGILAAAAGARRPRQFPVVSGGRVVLRDVDRVAAYEWLVVAGDRVAVSL